MPIGLREALPDTQASDLLACLQTLRWTQVFVGSYFFGRSVFSAFKAFFGLLGRNTSSPFLEPGLVAQ